MGEIVRVLNEYFRTHTLSEGSLNHMLSLLLQDYEKELDKEMQSKRDLIKKLTEIQAIGDYNRRMMLKKEMERDNISKKYAKTRKRNLEMRCSLSLYGDIVREKDNMISELSQDVHTLQKKLDEREKEIADLKAELEIREKEIGIKKFYGQ